MTQLPTLEVPDTRPLFAPLRAGLITLLRSLEATDWDRPTVAGAWRVRDVAAHLLDGELRTLAAHRDGHALATEGEVRSYADVISLIQRLNAEGVVAGRHLSDRLLVDLLSVTGNWMDEFLSELDPNARALFSVAWAGEMESTNLFDTAREYTERWHHEMQIRAAVGVRGDEAALLAEHFAVPLIETSLRVLPHAYRDCIAADGSTLVITVDASTWERTYTLRRDANTWRLHAGEAPQPTAQVIGTADAWWRLFFNAMPADSIQHGFTATGASEVVAPLWRSRSVMV